MGRATLNMPPSWCRRCGAGWWGQPGEQSGRGWPEGRQCPHPPARTPAPRTPRERPGVLGQPGPAAALDRGNDGRHADAGSDHARRRAHLALSRGQQRDHGHGAGDGCAGARPTPGTRARAGCKHVAGHWPVPMCSGPSEMHLSRLFKWASGNILFTCKIPLR